MKARVTIFYKDSVFDPQGNTIAGSLKRMGFGSVDDVRIEKVIDITLNQTDKKQAELDLTKMCDDLLANPVIESYQFEIQ